jgi:hypothetical protein
LAKSLAAASASSSSTARFVNLAEEDMTASQREIVSIQKRWNAVRLLSADEVAALEDDDLKAAHARYFERYHQDMGKMQEIADKLGVMLEPPKVAKKSKNQRKRDKFAIVTARLQARANAAKAAVKQE